MPKELEIVEVQLSQINLASGTQIRDCDAFAVARYSTHFERGLKLPPIKLWWDPEQERYYIIDGYHRVLAAQKMGAGKMRSMIVGSGDVVHARIEAANQTWNLLHGVPLTPRDHAQRIKTRLEAEATLKPKDRTVRQEMARQMCVDPSAIRKVFGEMTGQARKQLPPPPAGEPPQVPGPHPRRILTEAQESAAVLTELARSVSAAAKGVERIRAEPWAGWLSWQEAHDLLKQAAALLNYAFPAEVCPYCSGDKCDKCHQLGWVPAAVWSYAPQELK